ncbi:putative UDP-galactose translocator [Tribonema minus]|uniref:Putative UDP-galactose translocator n=1 Tax=Tribonema minus TaxID=303371 RepID=A0A835YXE8_9STRA|nr:putative UDP-galactose translocator [Tribonema minus]
MVAFDGGGERQSSEAINPRRGYVFMALLALQYGLQPLIQKSCIDRHAVNKVSLVVATEITKIAMCCGFILSTTGLVSELRATWTLRSSVKAAALPAACYALQNWLTQIGYMNLDSLTFNLLNQTKTLSAAVCLFLIMGRRQSGPQVLALMMLVAAALLLNAQSGGLGDAAAPISWELGILPVVGASLLSGFSAAVTQKSLQERGRNSFLLSAELAVYGVLTLLLPSAASTGSLQGLWEGWTIRTVIPVVTNAMGGVIVGQVTKHAGSVKKGFALIGGILVTAAAQFILERQPLSREHYASAVLVAVSTFLHTRYPQQQRSSKKAA